MHAYTKTCMLVFIAALFIIAKLGSKQDVPYLGTDKQNVVELCYRILFNDKENYIEEF